MKINRRSLIKGGLTAFAAGGTAGPVMGVKAASGDRNIAAIAHNLLEKNKERIAKTDRVGVVDYASPSWRPRFHLVDMIDGRISSFLVAHGRGSDPAHTGWLQSFSNAIGSYASSSGAYLTGARYSGKYGASMRLKGLDPANSNAEARAIVIHAAWYASPEMLTKYGKLGRSEGCFSLSEADRDKVVERLGQGRLLFAGKLGFSVT